MEERSLHAEALTPIHESDNAFIEQYHSLFIITIQKVGRVERLEDKLYSSDRDETTVVGKGVVAEECLQLCNMPWVHIMDKFLQILDLLDSEPGVDAIRNQWRNSHDVNCSTHSCSLLSKPSNSSCCRRTGRQNSGYGGFSCATPSLLDSPTRTRQRRTILPTWTTGVW